MRPDVADLLAFPIERLEDQRLKELVRGIAEAATATNDPDTLRDLGISLEKLGAWCRGEAFELTRSHW